MITVTDFTISADRTEISLGITVDSGQVVNDLKLWTEDTYKVVSEAVDLNSLISGASNTESITITTSDAGVESFNGIYIIQIESDDVEDVPGLVGAFDPSRLYGIIAYLLANVDLSCLNCNTNFQNAELIDAYLQGIINAIRLGRFRDAIEFLGKINIIEEYECSECCELSPVVSTAGNLVSVGVIDCILNS